MSDWKTKSESNFRAANKLILESFHDTSVHCSYYSCVQFMFHITFEYVGKTEEAINYESDARNNGGTGTHVWLQNLIVGQLKSKNKIDAFHFNNDIGNLKAIRVSGDYRNVLISKEKAEESRQLAHKTLQLLKKYFP